MFPRNSVLSGLRAVACAVIALVTAHIVGNSKAAVEVDTSFRFPTADPDLELVSWCLTLPDGKLLVGGNNAARLNSDGSRDMSFPLIPAPYGTPRPVLEPDGGFTVFGTSYAGPTSFGVAFGRRYQSNGIIDESFHADLPATATVFIARRDAAGGYLLAGTGLVPPLSNAPARWALIRLREDGSVDSKFVILEEFCVSALALDRDRSLVASGTSISSEGFAQEKRLIRLRPDGRVISSRRTSAASSNPSPADKLVTLPARRAIVAGEGPLVAQLLSSGELDPNFRPIYGEGPADPFARALKRLRNGQVLVGANVTGDYLAHTPEWPIPDTAARWPAFPLFKTLPDGLLDLSFTFDESAGDAIPSVFDICLQADGTMILATGSDLVRVRETPSGPVYAFADKRIAVSEDVRAASVTIYRSGDLRLPGWVTVSTSEADSTAAPGLDFRPLRLRVLFPPGVWRRSVQVHLKDDQVADGSKELVLRLTDPGKGGVVYSVDSLQIEIADDDQ